MENKEIILKKTVFHQVFSLICFVWITGYGINSLRTSMNAPADRKALLIILSLFFIILGALALFIFITTIRRPVAIINDKGITVFTGIRGTTFISWPNVKLFEIVERVSRGKNRIRVKKWIDIYALDPSKIEFHNWKPRTKGPEEADASFCTKHLTIDYQEIMRNIQEFYDAYGAKSNNGV